jgi:hypothetical protein
MGGQKYEAVEGVVTTKSKLNAPVYKKKERRIAIHVFKFIYLSTLPASCYS